MKHILLQNTPKPSGTYSHAVKYNGMLFVSGQLPTDPQTLQIVSNDTSEQIRQCFKNIEQICLGSGTSLDLAIKINVYYTDITVSNCINAVMEEFFKEPYPARIRLQVAGLSKGAKVEIDGIFACKE